MPRAAHIGPRAARAHAATAVGAVLAALAVLAVLAAGARAAEPPAGPEGLQARTWILVEPSTGDVVAARDPDERRAIASTTKLMTALLALEAWDDLSEDVEVVDYPAAAAESTAGLRAGEELSRADLLRALLLASANEAAATIAQRVAGSEEEFVDRMNAKARELGLSARYRNPVGLDAPGARASAADLVKLTEVLRRDAFFRRTTDETSARLTTGATPRTVVNRNGLVQDVPWVDGVKTGHTRDAGYVLVSSGSRDGVRMIAAVLGDPSEAARDADSLALLRYGMARYERRTAVRDGAVLARRPLRSRDASVPLVAGASVRRVARDGERVTTRVTGVPADVEGPLPAGARLGTAEVLQRDRVVARVPVVTAAAVPAASLWERSDDVLGSPTGLLLLLLILLCVVALVLVARRRRAEAVAVPAGARPPSSGARPGSSAARPVRPAPAGAARARAGLDAASGRIAGVVERARRAVGGAPAAPAPEEDDGWGWVDAPEGRRRLGAGDAADGPPARPGGDATSRRAASRTAAGAGRAGGPPGERDEARRRSGARS